MTSGPSQPLVSVVTPCFNAAAHIGETIRSVQTQEYPAIEHIVIDGGSTDGTTAILRQQPHLHWISEKDRGQSDALNKGFARATGGIVGWLNADDTYEPGAIRAAVAFLISHPDVDAVYSDANIIDASGTKTGVSPAAAFDLVRLLQDNMVKQPTVFMRREMVAALGGVDRKYHYVMDHEFWLRAGMTGYRFHYLAGRPLANFRLCEGTKTSERAPKFSEEWQEVQHAALAAPCFNQLSPPEKRRILRHTRANYHLARMLDALDGGRRREVVASCARMLREESSLALNRGTWKFLALGVLGLKRDKHRRFRAAAATAKASPHA